MLGEFHGQAPINNSANELVHRKVTAFVHELEPQHTAFRCADDDIDGFSEWHLAATRQTVDFTVVDGVDITLAKRSFTHDHALELLQLAL